MTAAQRIQPAHVEAKECAQCHRVIVGISMVERDGQQLHSFCVLPWRIERLERQVSGLLGRESV